MRRALQLAAMGCGKVSPNPMVGAVVVANGRIIGEGYHHRYGGPHAEVNAIASVSEADEKLLKESTIYVTLEPCSHYGKTPPCSKLIIDKQIPNIVVGCMDPFKEVSGRGIAMLRQAGREVVTGVLEKECRALNSHFMTAHTLHRPYILLKWAESADRFIDSDRTPEAPPFVLSNAVTQALVHKLRSEFDAIMVGSTTAIADNPSLTIRHWTGRNPLRIVLDRQGITANHSLKIYTDGYPTLVFTNKPRWTYSAAVDFSGVPSDENLLRYICSELYRRGITSLMVEGGATLINHFIDERLWDEVRIERTPLILGQGVKAPAIPDGIFSQTPIAHSTITTIHRAD